MEEKAEKDYATPPERSLMGTLEDIASCPSFKWQNPCELLVLIGIRKE